MGGKRKSYPDGAKTCTHCGVRKSLEHFYRHRDTVASWCKVCVRIGISMQQKTEQAAATRAERRSRPEVRERMRRADRKRRPRGAPRPENQTPRGRLLHCRRQARVQLRRATREDRRRALMSLIAAYDRELKRLER